MECLRSRFREILKLEVVENRDQRIGRFRGDNRRLGMPDGYGGGSFVRMIMIRAIAMVPFLTTQRLPLPAVAGRGIVRGIGRAVSGSHCVGPNSDDRGVATTASGHPHPEARVIA